MRQPEPKVKAKASKAPALTTKVKASKAKRLALIAKKRPDFNAKAFLETVGVGRFVGKYKRGEVVFLQADPADAVDHDTADIDALEGAAEPLLDLAGRRDVFLDADEMGDLAVGVPDRRNAEAVPEQAAVGASVPDRDAAGSAGPQRFAHLVEPGLVL